MTRGEYLKSKGIESTEDLSSLSGVSTTTLRDWFDNNRKAFDSIVEGALANIKKSTKQADCFVLCSERDTCDDRPDSQPIVFETFINNSSLSEIKARAEQIGDRYGKLKIARLTFLKGVLK